MNTESNGATGYRVIPVETVKAKLRRYHKEMVGKGRGAKFLAVLRQVYFRLRNDPREFGEPLYRLPALELMIHQGIILPIVVTYGIHESLPLVIIRGVKFLSDPKE